MHGAPVHRWVNDNLTPAKDCFDVFWYRHSCFLYDVFSIACRQFDLSNDVFSIACRQFDLSNDGGVFYT